MQQHHMQMQQPMMATYHSQNLQVTTDIIQQYLDENKQLILAILHNQNAGKAEECAQNQAKLQRNLMYLAAIADNQTPQVPTVAQYPPNAVVQPGTCYMQPQQMTPQFLLAARSSMLYEQSPVSALQKQQQAALHNQIGVSSGANSGFNVLHGERSLGVNGPLATGVFPDLARGSSKKEEGEHALSADGRGGNSGGQSADGTESRRLKASGEEAN